MNSSKPINRLYFINGIVDYTTVGGLSILTYIAFSLYSGEKSVSQVIPISTFLMWIINWPHFSATLYRLYSRKENREQYPLTSWVIPFFVGLCTVGAFSFPSVIAPFF